MKYIKNPDQDFCKEMKKRLKQNSGHCPCALQKTPDTKCMCKDFREAPVNTWCGCGLYYKEED